jgi:ABC-2 type transport system permease protein
MRTLRLAWSFVKRDATIALSYRTAFFMPLISIVIAVPVLSFVGRVFVASDSQVLGEYSSGGYFVFLLLGMAFQDYVSLSMSTFLNGIREHQLMGTLEVVMLSPTPVSQILLFSSIWSYLFTSLRFAMYLLMGLVFGIDLSAANLAGFVLVGGMGILCFAAMGILGAAVTLIIKQGSSITTFLTAATLALGGVAYPLSVLPPWLQDVAQLLPFTHALSGVRKALLLGAGPAELGTELGALGLFALALFPLGLWAFQAALRRVKITGTLGQY